MVYDWMLSPLNSSYSNIASRIISLFIGSVIPCFLKMLAAPFVNSEILLITSPLMLATILMALYFARYRNEEIGWNTAFSNNIFMMFIMINLIQHLWQEGMINSNKFLLVIALMAYNLIQLLLNYFHILPKKISFSLNSTLLINIISYLAIVIVYSNLPLDNSTLLASVIFFSLLMLTKNFLWIIVPMSRGSKIFESIQKKREERARMLEARRLRRNESLNMDEFKTIKYGIFSFLVIYSLLFIANRFKDIREYYLLILSSYFLLFFTYYIRKNRLKMKNLLLKGEPIKRDMGVALGIFIFFYYIIASNFFVAVFNIGQYKTNNLLLIINILLSSISSELFFRGIIQRGLKIRYNKRLSVSIQALLWSLLKYDVFSFSSPLNAIAGIIIIYPVGLLLGYVKEEMWFDSCLSASLTNSSLAILSLLL